MRGRFRRLGGVFGAPIAPAANFFVFHAADVLGDALRGFLISRYFLKLKNRGTK